jgi:hypothetical protein
MRTAKDKPEFIDPLGRAFPPPGNRSSSKLATTDSRVPEVNATLLTGSEPGKNDRWLHTIAPDVIDQRRLACSLTTDTGWALVGLQPHHVPVRNGMICELCRSGCLTFDSRVDGPPHGVVNLLDRVIQLGLRQAFLRRRRGNRDCHRCRDCTEVSHRGKQWRPGCGCV